MVASKWQQGHCKVIPHLQIVRFNNYGRCSEAVYLDPFAEDPFLTPHMTAINLVENLDDCCRLRFALLSFRRKNAFDAIYPVRSSALIHSRISQYNQLRPKQTLPMGPQDSRTQHSRVPVIQGLHTPDPPRMRAS